MSLPREVEKQDKLAEELHAQLYGNSEQVSEEVAEPVEAQDSQTAAEDSGSDEIEGIVKGIEVREEASMIKPESQDGEPEAQKKRNDWKKKYQTLSGKYSAEVPRMAAEIKELKAREKRREEEHKRLLERKKAEPLVKKEEVEEYGEGLIDVVRRAAREELAGRDQTIESLKSEIDNLKGASAKTEEIGFYQHLSNKHPDWQSINEDSKFHQWLDEPDTFSGKRRQDLLTEAEQDRDAQKIANIFSAYKKTLNIAEANANEGLEKQVVPERAAAASAPPGKRLWTRNDINKFYYELRRGSIPEKQALAIEKEIQSAITEGRVS